MYVETIDDIIRLIKKRDNLSIKEARIMVDDCVEAIKEEVGKNEPSILECEDIVREYLGLEPEFLEIILNELMWGEL